jgi:hypothetical protein
VVGGGVGQFELEQAIDQAFRTAQLLHGEGSLSMLPHGEDVELRGGLRGLVKLNQKGRTLMAIHAQHTQSRYLSRY